MRLEKAFGFGLLVIGVIVLVITVFLVILAILSDRLAAGVGAIAMGGLVGGAAVVIGSQMLHEQASTGSFPRPAGTEWVVLGAIVMVPAIWEWSLIFLDGRNVEPGIVRGMVPLLSLGIILGTLWFLPRAASSRGAKIAPWHWGLVVGVIAGIGGGFEVSFYGRGVVWSTLGGLVAGTILALAIGGFFAWWSRFGKPWAIEAGIQLRGPLA